MNKGEKIIFKNHPDKGWKMGEYISSVTVPEGTKFIVRFECRETEVDEVQKFPDWIERAEEENPRSMIDDILETDPDAEFITADGFNDAIIGYCIFTNKIIYSVKKCIQILTKEEGLTEIDAMEHFDYNVRGSHGIKDSEGEDKTPIFSQDIF